MDRRAVCEARPGQCHQPSLKQQTLTASRKLFLTQLVGRMITRGTSDLSIDERAILEAAVKARYRSRFETNSAAPIMLSDLKRALEGAGNEAVTSKQ